MQPVEAILFEPVGCLAEFPAGPFDEIAARFFGGRRNATRSGSRSYWHLLNLMQASGRITPEFEPLEIEAVNNAEVYEDVAPALTELKRMGVELFLASSLSKAAIDRFRKKCPFSGYSAVFSREDAGGIKDAPLRAAPCRTANTLFLTDTAEGLWTAKTAGVNAILMMNDPDESRRLAMQDPAGGIVSLLELPDFVRVVAAQNKTGIPL